MCMHDCLVVLKPCLLMSQGPWLCLSLCHRCWSVKEQVKKQAVWLVKADSVLAAIMRLLSFGHPLANLAPYPCQRVGQKHTPLPGRMSASL